MEHAITKSIYCWKCFLKEDRKPWIVNIAHEQFSYIENSVNEDINEDIKALKTIEGLTLEELKVN